MPAASRREETDLHRAIESAASAIDADVIADRRAVHRHAEAGWTEYWTTSLIAKRLEELGYETLVGRRVCASESRMGVPAEEALEAHRKRAEAQGADPKLLESMRGGFTGAIGERSHSKGPVIALRVDIDGLDIREDRTTDHRPAREGFASINDGASHACGHDGHVAIGLGVARVLAELPAPLAGTVRLIFQPADEGVRGARSIGMAGHLADADYVLGCHLLAGWAVGELAPGLGGYAATRKFDVAFFGEAAHAGALPEGGRNALLAAATAALHLHALPRHHAGFTRVHVGRMEAGTGRNVIPDRALLIAEVRGGTGELCESMYERAVRVVKSAAVMYECDAEIHPMGQAGSAESDPTLAKQVRTSAGRAGRFTFHDVSAVGGSEDFVEMMRAVQAHGGLAANIGIGADFHGTRRDDADRSRVLAPHSPTFDFDERGLGVGVRVLSHLAVDLAAAWRAEEEGGHAR